MDTGSSGQHADLRERLQTALGADYTIERELGGGGMSRVFVVQDVRLGRRVVVKVLHPDLAAGVSAQRFEREVRLAARLQHPHVVPLLSADDLAGLPFYTMPYVQGESLRDRLRREGALPITDAVRIVRELADALAYAHTEGVVHRDLKPENVLLSGAHAMVADFGVAKALSAATHGTEERESDVATTVGRTELGVAVGTPAYMAPEQAAADPAADHRVDLYALGVIAYEALAGIHPFAGRSPQALLAAHLTESPSPLTARRQDLPRALGDLVAQLLSKRPEDRPMSAADVIRALDAVVTPTGRPAALLERIDPRKIHVMLGALIAASALAAVVLTRRGSTATSDAPVAARASATAFAPRRVAVAPFENQSGDTTLAALGSLTSDWLSQGLAEAAFAEVVDPQTVRSVWQSGANARAVGIATDARYVVSGTYHVAEDSLRMFARITDAVDGKVLRVVEPVTVPAGRSRQGVSALRERVLGAVGMILDSRLSTDITARNLPPSLEAYRHYSAAGAHLYRNDSREAIREYLAAARLDSTFVPPVLYAAMSHMMLGEHNTADSLLLVASRRREYLAPADRFAIDLWRAENHGDWAAALQAAQEAARDTNQLNAFMLTGWNATRTNRPRAALAALRRLDPERPPYRQYAPYWEVRTQAYHLLGDYRAELTAARRAKEQHPEHVPVLYAEARALAAIDQNAVVERRLDEIADAGSDPLTTPAEVAWALGRELRTHRQEAAAQSAFAWALRWYDGRPSAERSTPALRGRRAEVLYAAGHWDEARRLFEQLASERPGEPNPVGDNGMYGLSALGEVDYQGYLGALAARRGDRATAVEADRALNAWPGDYLLGRNTYWRARIASLLGDAERAVELLRQALQQGRTYVMVHAESDFIPLRQLPAFQELVRPKG